MFESTKVRTIVQRLSGKSLLAVEVEWRGEPRQRPSPGKFVLTIPIRDPGQFLRQHRADAGAAL